LKFMWFPLNPVDSSIVALSDGLTPLATVLLTGLGVLCSALVVGARSASTHASQALDRLYDDLSRVLNISAGQDR